MPKRINRQGRKRSGGVVQELRKDERVSVHRFPSAYSASMSYPVVLRYRFIGGSIGTFPVTRKMLLDIFVQGDSTTSYSRIWSNVKLRKIEVWGGTLSTTATTNVVPFTSVSLEWLSTYGPGNVKSDTGNFERPPHLECRPPPRSLAGFWSLVGSNESDVIFKLSGSSSAIASGPFIGVPAGSIVDLHLQVTNQDDEAVTLYTALSGVTVGQNYVRDFVTAPGVSPGFAPEAYTTIA